MFVLRVLPNDITHRGTTSPCLPNPRHQEAGTGIKLKTAADLMKNARGFKAQGFAWFAASWWRGLGRHGEVGGAS